MDYKDIKFEEWKQAHYDKIYALDIDEILRSAFEAGWEAGVALD